MKLFTEIAKSDSSCLDFFKQLMKNYGWNEFDGLVLLMHLICTPKFEAGRDFDCRV